MVHTCTIKAGSHHLPIETEEGYQVREDLESLFREENMLTEDMNRYREELEKLIDLLDRVHTPQARQVIASRFQQVLAEIVSSIDKEVA